MAPCTSTLWEMTGCKTHLEVDNKLTMSQQCALAEGRSAGPALGKAQPLRSKAGDGPEHTLSTSASNTKLEGVADVPGGSVSIQRDLSGLEKWDNRNFMEFSKENFQILHSGRNNHRNQYLLENTQLESSLAEKDLGVLVITKLNMSQKHTFVAKKINVILGCIRPSVASKSRGVMPFIQHW
ncbi:rna-directed dna polymerase from mobile element jockey-like [Willisornis vidua]|uniref:Rna-directed dna polymerase from mobile element jockey-like n=1 Tax=Willisornis vidua TaxID=1566151 RepID=A0ABQ9DHY2_9PASS|nr:rna-directed dna polymerase from mobile element jockey-like [Willisornis vidua]